MASGPVPPLVGLGRDLRDRGLPVGTGRILTFVRGRRGDRPHRSDVAVLGRPGDDGRRAATTSRRTTRRSTRGSGRSGCAREPELSSSSTCRRISTTLELGDDRTRPTWTRSSTAASVAHADEGDEEADDGDEAALRLVASAVEILRPKSFAYLDRGGAPARRAS